MSEIGRPAPVLFHLTRPRQMLFLPMERQISLLEYPSRILLAMANDIAQQGRPVIVYMWHECRHFSRSARDLREICEFGGEIIEVDGDDDFEELVAEREIATCVLVHGIWTFRIQAICRSRNIGVVLVEAPAFERDDAVFIDTVGVTMFSSLAAFRPRGALPADGPATLQRLRDIESAERVFAEPYILLLLERSDSVFWPFDPRHYDIRVVVQELSAQFPRATIAVRAHPDDPARATLELPGNCLFADHGSVSAWAQHCDWAVGFSSKATFSPLLYGRSVVVLARGLTNFFNESPVFIETHKISHLSIDNISARRRPLVADEFIYHLVSENHLRITDKDGPRRERNRRSGIYRRLLLGERN